MSRRLVLLSGAVVALSVAGLTAHAASSSADTEKDERSGDRLAEYLGTNIGPREWDIIIRDAGTGIPQCEAEFASADERGQKSYSESSQQRFEDRNGYEQRYGYGVIQSIVDIKVAVGQEAPDTESTAEPSRSQVEGCLGLLQSTIDQFGAPPVVWQRYAELINGASGTPEYLSALGEWRGCMAKLSHEVSSPDEMSVFVGAMITEREDALGLSHPHQEGTEYLTDLDLGELAQLQDIEVGLFMADMECRRSTGLEDLRYDLESIILRALNTEFPDFDGVNFHRGQG